MLPVQAAMLFPLKFIAQAEGSNRSNGSKSELTRQVWATLSLVGGLWWYMAEGHTKWLLKLLIV